MEPLILHPKPTGVTRLKRLPLVVGLMIFGALMFYLLMQLAQRQSSAFADKDKQPGAYVPSTLEDSQSLWFEDQKYDQLRPYVNSNSIDGMEEEMSGLQGQGDVEEVRLDNTEKPGDLRSIHAPNHYPHVSSISAKKSDLEALRARYELDEEKNRMEAMRAPMRVPLNQTHSAPSSLLAGNRSLLSGVKENTPLIRAEGAEQGSQSEKETFLNQASEPNHYLPHRKLMPLSAHEVKAGTILPAALITGINSDLPGSVTAQIRENVYDTVTGNEILVPQGTKLIGEYDSRVAYGQDRALVIWSRLIFPDGQSFYLERMQGVDGGGYAGFHDEVDHHYGRIYGSAFLMSLLGAGYELLNKDTDTQEEQDMVAAAIGQQVAQVSSEMIRKNLRIQPTIIIRPGYRFNVLVMKDMIL